MKPMTEYEMIAAAGDALRERGVTVSPGNVEKVVNHARRPVSVAKAVEGVTELVERAKRVGLGQQQPKPQAQQYATPSIPYWVEPRLDEQRRAEYEATAAGIRTELQSSGLTPAQRIRLEQSLKLIERVLAKTDGGDAVRPNFR